MNTKTADAFSRLVGIMNDLREKCPWDKKQTIQSLRQMTIEETYELADAITEGDWKGIKEELGDLLLHIVFYAKIGSEQKQFELDEVINDICEKHDADDVKRNWEKLKLKEGKKSVIGGVPRSLPATVKAMRLQEKAKQGGFEWENKEQVWEKVEEEIIELKSAINDGNQTKMEEEFGDVVFSLINYARFLQIDAENALEMTNKKFIHRFTQMEEKAMQSGKNLDTMTLEEMDTIWNTIKQQRPE